MVLVRTHDEMSSSYLSYAMSVIVSRALPDVRDGLKPVHRRILYAMYKGGFTCGRNVEKGQSVAKNIQDQTGVPVYFIEADLADITTCRKLIARCDQNFGRLDVLVNAAGLTDRGNLLETSEELFDRMFAINTKAPFVLMQEAVKRMIRESIEGAIVNIGSTSALAGQPFIAPYCASKGALATLTRNSG